MPRRLASAAAVLALAVGAAACGDDETTTASSETDPAASSTTVEETTQSTTTVDSENVNTDFGALTPDVEVDEREGTPPPPASADLEAAAEAAGCDLQLDLPDEGNKHLDDPEEIPAYETSPPTSGDHFADFNETGAGAFADGAFLDTPPANRVVHSLEHGRVAIQYSPDLAEEDQLALKGVFDDDRPGVLLFPNPEMPYEVATTAWTQLMGCDSYAGDATLEAVQAFRDEFRGKGPEAVTF